ncbi:MAG: B12-binding domain-containing radical SAM protein [Acidobacteria bacterium]|nr:B12-binding domain-containing radical SAM protein [Acidobacteriota bacterium]
MKVLLVYPEFPDTYWSFRHALHFYGKRAAFPPLGLLTVSAMLPRTWERRLVDLNVQPLRDAQIEWADMVFVSAMLVQKDSLRRVVARCKARGKRVVVGGPYVTTLAEKLDGVDHIFMGEAETTLPEFVHDLEHGEPKHVYQAAERPALTLTPPAEFHLADLSRYFAMPVQYSRGCPFQCEFCDIIEIYGRVPRTKSNEQILAELDELVRLGWRGRVFIVDDNFIGNKRNVKRLLPELAEWSERNRHPFAFLTEASVNLAEDDELLEGMRRAGFRSVFLGIETPVAESLKETLKHQNTRGDLLESVHKIQKYGMDVMAGFIVGFDNDPEDVFERQINFIRESAIPLAMVGILQALPGTQLWRRLEREGRLLAEGTGNISECALTFIPKMDSARLIEGYQSIIRNIYSPREYYLRTLDSLSRVVQMLPEPRRTSFFGDLAAFARVVLTLGVRDRERNEFWKFFRTALTDHRERFEMAMRLAAMGYHLRKLAESNLEQ